MWLPKRFGVHKNLTGHGPVSFWPLYGRFVTGQMTVLSFRWWMVDIIAANGPVIFIAAFRPVKKPLDRPIDRSPVLFACRHNVNLRSQKKKKKSKQERWKFLELCSFFFISFWLNSCSSLTSEARFRTNF